MLGSMDGLPAERILEIAAQHGVKDVRVFGSRARGDARPDSDLDLLITPGLDTTPPNDGGPKAWSLRRTLVSPWKSQPKPRSAPHIGIGS